MRCLTPSDCSSAIAHPPRLAVSALYLHLVPSILPPAAPTSAPIRPSVPYATLSAFLLIALRLPSTLSSPSSPLVSLTLSYLSQAESWAPEAYHLPSAEEFLRSSWHVLFASAESIEEKLALAKGGLQARSVEVQRAALAALETLGRDAQRAAELLARVVLSEKYAGDVRVQAAELVRELGGARVEAAGYEAFAALYSQTPIVPLREAVLPLLAGAARDEVEQRAVLQMLTAASSADEVRLNLQFLYVPHRTDHPAPQSVESRESASLALLALSRESFAPVLASRYMHLVARLMQDDDPVVRENAERASGARLVEGKAVERALQEGGDATRELLAEEEQSDFGACTCSLFCAPELLLTPACRARPRSPVQPDLAPLCHREAQHLHRLRRRRLAPPLILYLAHLEQRSALGAGEAQRGEQEP